MASLRRPSLLPPSGVGERRVERSLRREFAGENHQPRDAGLAGAKSARCCRSSPRAATAGPPERTRPSVRCGTNRRGSLRKPSLASDVSKAANRAAICSWPPPAPSQTVFGRRGVGKGPGPANLQLERRRDGRRPGHGVANPRNLLHRHLVEELDRQMEVFGVDPFHVGPDGGERLDQRHGLLADAIIQFHGDERADGAFHAAASPQ